MMQSRKNEVVEDRPVQVAGIVLDCRQK